MTPESSFPLDDATLILLRSACEINPESERTHLQDFLRMGSVEKSRHPECYCGQTDFCETPDECLIDEEDPQSGSIFFVEHEVGREPFSEHEVIRCLVDEIQRLRNVITEQNDEFVREFQAMRQERDDWWDKWLMATVPRKASAPPTSPGRQEEGERE